MEVSQKCQSNLYKNFGRENRIIRNYIKILQNLKQKEKVEKFQEELLKQNLNDTILIKSDLAYKKQSLSKKEYVKLLTEYLKKNWEDFDTWLELGEIYENNQNFKNAIYCYEEILLINPKKFELYQKLGELHFSLGKLENFIIARKYFCFLLSLNQDCYRTIYALGIVCQFLSLKEKNIVNKKILGICNKRLEGIKKGRGF